MTAELGDVIEQAIVAEILSNGRIDTVVSWPRRDEDLPLAGLGDCAVAQILQLKHPDEQISTAVWWRVAQLVRAVTAAVAAREADLALVRSAFDAADEVLISLARDDGDGDGSRAPALVDARPPLGRGSDARAAARKSCARVTRLLLTTRLTPPAVLATLVNQLRRSLAAWQFALLDAGRPTG